MALRLGGVGQYTCDGVVTEVATSTCAHCQRMTDIPSRKRMMECVDVCRNCMRFVCLRCAGKPCTPFMKLIERKEQEYYRKVQNAKILGI